MLAKYFRLYEKMVVLTKLELNQVQLGFLAELHKGLFSQVG